MTTHKDNLGRYMVSTPAGGPGSRSAATRPATDAEISAFHRKEIAEAEAKLKAAREAHDEHHSVVVGAPPPPGPLDPNSVVAQGVGNPGEDDKRLGAPLGGHTKQQGQPGQPTDVGTHAPHVPEKTMPPVRSSADVNKEPADAHQRHAPARADTTPTTKK